jgi:Kef-type K+ transport system membrane component KefB/mannitol/fructose-specific phosphotransferase system IIA component (Ntr-type)
MPLSHHDITVLVLGLALLLLVARTLGEVAIKLHQPAIVGELLAGVLLGPTVLGACWPAAMNGVFPASGPVAVVMHGLTTLSIILYLLVAGLEVDLWTIWRRRFAAVSVGLGGMVVPVAVALPLALAAPAAFGAEPATPLSPFALFFATAMSISALPVIARILTDLQLYRTDLGMTVVAAAVINDLAGWIAFALILTMIGQSSGLGLGLVGSIALTLAFVAFMLSVGRLLIDRALPWAHAHLSWPGGLLNFVLVLGLACAAFTEWIGVHAIFGAFICGVALGDSRHLRARTRATIEHFVSFIFAPLFFASIGLRINFIEHFDLWLVLTVIAIATVTKVGGCFVAAWLARFTARDSLAISFAMNARGAMEIVLGLLALEAGLIGERLFVALVVMALVTSLLSGSLIQWVLGQRKATRFWSYASARSFVSELSARSGSEVIVELSMTLSDSGVDPASITRAALSRERTLGSGIGGGVAVPHARIDGLERPLVAIGRSSGGVDFDSRDGSLSHLIILIVTPSNDTDTQLHLLASIASVCHDPATVNRLVSAANWTEFLGVLNTLRDRPNQEQRE